MIGLEIIGLKVSRFEIIGLNMIGFKAIGVEIIGLEMIFNRRQDDMNSLLFFKQPP